MERGNYSVVKGARGFGNRFITTDLDSANGDKEEAETGDDGDDGAAQAETTTEG
jgi:hypothetical protein